ncbi:hypothetical protein [Cohnella rhizosphaerae]|uniref:Uncharacterized protein n=1 Tax=Cohnella rhizosphaerae TaxID=1457232 RepID=A0A9X4KPE0_9BACL|nr:hypothetical protein [Cohnella rhizosphaerae]MDG0808731.1 hypothetical protein [Cohnella rhizosphaerae]
MRKKIAAALVALALTGALAACGAKNDENAGQETAVASQDLIIRATNWQFDQAEYKVPKDTPIRYTLENEQGAHGIEIEKAGVKLSNGKKIQGRDAGGRHLYDQMQHRMRRRAFENEGQADRRISRIKKIAPPSGSDPFGGAIYVRGRFGHRCAGELYVCSSSISIHSLYSICSL